MVDVTEGWVESMRCIDSVQFDFQGPNYIHPESDIKSRPSISNREQLRAMYPECFTGIGPVKCQSSGTCYEEDCTSTNSQTR